ncbi:metal-dependent hydrolase [Sporosarcina cyprini]|uniref:metal-dependent hydrolase n=1 Tax=Sporosarcina cyprini TaxID=2910523 RepID=UPI001EDFD78F|nr:metal-dependent hydrolase [Sporosarcina cyprini]MCG3088004.1 metal-dependent hydrolase [Sporosarcina cyprini]
MDGTSHFVIGLAAGAVAGFQASHDPIAISVCTAIGGISGLAPDLDTNGLASNRITVSKKVAQAIMQLIGISVFLLITYRFLTDGLSTPILVYGAIGLVLLIVSRLITQRRILTLTGVLVMLLGFVLHQSIGILLAGSYIIIASFLPHRSYTHSLLGVAFYGFILVQFHDQWPIEGMVAAGLAGYASHLIADMKILPMNRRGVKWFAPIWKREF